MNIFILKYTNSKFHKTKSKLNVGKKMYVVHFHEFYDFLLTR